MSARNGQGDPGHEVFTWRGIKFYPPDGNEPGGFYSSKPIEVAPDRVADWKVHRPKTVWHARLRIGAERYPGVGETPGQALEAAAAEAQNVAAFIVAMLPAPSSPRASKKRAARRPGNVRLVDGCSRRR
jgi:hypothetical protein